MPRRVLALLAGLAAFAAQGAPPQAGVRPDHVDETECRACHAEAARRWDGSKHRQAMQPATADKVLGDFDGGEFAREGETVRFLRRGDAFRVVAAGADGKAAELPVSHTFGVYPLQQYLVPLPGGRLQALTVAWDLRARRWFSLYPAEPVPPGSPLHWSGRYQNWNLMCGECHTTAYAKGYDEAGDRYATTWAVPTVGCQACHGPGRAHAESARRIAAGAASGAKPEPTPNRALGQGPAQVDQCAACHARRTRLAERTEPGRPFLDDFIPDNLRADLYHADGQQLEEVFEYGSYRQSRMYQAGVACSDCHEPHGGKLRAEGDALCVSCHNESPPARFPGLVPARYDAATHHFHAEGGAGSRCVECHMPGRNYMVVHERRDHAIRVPRPDLTRRIGTPNACQGCHADRTPEWAEAAIRSRHGERVRPEHYGEVFAAARAGRPEAVPKLATLAAESGQPAIVRASAVEILGAAGVPVPPAALADADPVVRVAAAAALASRPAPERLAGLVPLLDDARRAVRITAARGLADLADDAIPGSMREPRRRALAEYVEAQRAMADMPAAQLNLAAFHLVTGDPGQAAVHYRRAIAQDPTRNVARLGLARLLVGAGRHGEAAALLRDGLAASGNPGELHFALGLVAGERQRWAEAARELEAAASRLPQDPRIHRNLEAVRRHLREAPPR